MKIATIEVEHCGKCPHLVLSLWICPLGRKGKGQHLKSIIGIPDWCPLPEKEE